MNIPIILVVYREQRGICGWKNRLKKRKCIYKFPFFIVNKNKNVTFER